MIEEFGTVVELKGKQVAVVLCQRHSACDHCPSSGACQIGDDKQSMLVEAFNQIGAEVSDRVKIVTSSRNFLQSSFLLYIVPIIGLLIGALIGQVLGEYLQTGLEPTLLSAILGVAFMAGTFLSIRVGTRALSRELYMPRITEIQHQPDVQAEELKHGN
ncbi:MAG: SoxR reducing system RseC family protein [Desulfuromonadales bacterium]|nr:SoxR reducing system RseC family protein [Desulfuromonadales bacterium]